MNDNHTELPKGITAQEAADALRVCVKDVEVTIKRLTHASADAQAALRQFGIKLDEIKRTRA